MGIAWGVVSCSDIHNRWVLLARQQYTESYKEKPVGVAVLLKKRKVQLTCSPLVKPLAARVESRLESIAVLCGGSGSTKPATWPRRMWSTTSKCFTTESDVIPIWVASARRPLRWPPFEAGVCHAYRGKSKPFTGLMQRQMLAACDLLPLSETAFCLGRVKDSAFLLRRKMPDQLLLSLPPCENAQFYCQFGRLSWTSQQIRSSALVQLG